MPSHPHSMDFERLRAPTEDGGILIEPAPARWPELIEHNCGLLRASGPMLAGVPATEVRRSSRCRLLGGDGTVIASGHQPAFVHAGVWAKHVVVHNLSKHLGIRGVDLVVDNDAPAIRGLTAATVAPDGLVSTMDIPFVDAVAGTTYEAHPEPAPDECTRAQDRLREAMGTRYDASMMPLYLESFASTGGGFVARHLAGRAAIDRSLRADLEELRVSRAFGGPFLVDLLTGAERFAAAYNRALAGYREREGVRQSSRPLPDLGRDGGRIETALWTYTLTPPVARRRLWVASDRDTVRCYAGPEPIGVLSRQDLLGDADAAIRSLGPWLIRPRALTLTLWARLLLCDLFVHGIGGAKYDRITDDIFRGYYGCEPPAYACVSATLLLPLPRQPVTRDTLRAARRDLRDLWYNPDRHVPQPRQDLLVRRRTLISASQEARRSGSNRTDRRRIFLSIREANASLLEDSEALQQEYASRISTIESLLASNAVAGSREYFYALHPRERLAGLAERLREAMGPARLPEQAPPGYHGAAQATAVPRISS